MAMKKVKKKTLKWVNEIRKDHGARPVKDFEKGICGSATCPIAMTIKRDLDVRVYVQKGQTSVIMDGISTCYPSTEYVEEFIRRFDTRVKYQEYASESSR